MDWIKVLREKQAELELIASWASQVDLRLVRDYCRSAAFELKKEISFRTELEKDTK